MPESFTKSSRKPFNYEFTECGDLEIQFGQGFLSKVSARKFQLLLSTFKGQKIVLGTSRDNPPKNSLGEWLQANVTKSAIASYLGPILVETKHARWEPNNGKALVLTIL